MQRKNNSRCIHSLEHLTRAGVEFIIWGEVITFVGIIYFTISRSMIVIFCIRGTSGGTFTTVMNFSLNSVFSKWGHVLTITMAYLWRCNLFRKEHHFQKDWTRPSVCPVPKVLMVKYDLQPMHNFYYRPFANRCNEIFNNFSFADPNLISMNNDVLNTKVCYRFIYVALLDLCVDICST